jgi:hypothetical protein
MRLDRQRKVETDARPEANRGEKQEPARETLKTP